MRYQTSGSYCRIRRGADHLATAARHVIERLETRVLLSAGQPDPSFGTNGVVTTTFSAAPQGADAHRLALQSDGKILATGSAGLVRYTAAGTLDSSFGQGGIVSVPGGADEYAVAVQPDGKILVTAYVNSSASYALLRYTASGLPDSSLGAGGKVLTDIWSPNIAVRPDGRIILAGSNTPNTATELASYLPNGQPDVNFGTGGKVSIDTGLAGGPTAMTLQLDGKIDFVGTRVVGTYNNDWYLTRLNADGTPDASFGIGGTVLTDFAGQSDYPTSLTCECGGDIIVAGGASVGGVEYSALAFYTPSGALDLSRGTAGKVTSSFDLIGSATAVATAVAVQPADGKILCAANVDVDHAFGVYGEDFWGLARYMPAGNLDPTFGTGGISLSNGVAVTDPYKGTNVAGMALQDDGRIVLAGTRFSDHMFGHSDFVVARYLGDAGPLVSTAFSGQPISVPAGTIEAENFDNGGEGVAYHDATPQNLGGAYRNSFVDVLALPGASNGYAVGYTDAGEWLKYSINVTAGGTYVLQSRVASFLPGGTFHVELDGSNVTGALNVPNTGSWSTWQTLTSRPFTLSSGNHVMRLVEDHTGTLGAVANFDTFTFAALPGLADPSFGNNGIVTTSFGVGREEAIAWGMAIQPDGKIVVTGDTGSFPRINQEGNFILVRYTPAGALDISFGQGGIVFVPGSANGRVANGRSIAVQPDGKILVTAYLSNPPESALLRYTDSGLLDSSFGVGGKVPCNIQSPNIAVQPDGRIVVAGSSNFNSVFSTELASYLPNGQPDLSFGMAGKVSISTGPGAGGATAMTLQPDGKIDFVGRYLSGVGEEYYNEWYLARLNANGTPDSSFGTNGTMLIDFGGAYSYPAALTCEAGGDIIVAGGVPVGNAEYSGLAFCTPAGALDLSRGTAGKVTTNFGLLFAHPGGVAVHPADGKIVVAAGLGSGTSYILWGLARYTPDGNLDPTFGSGGISISNVLGNTGFNQSRLAGMALGDDGKIVLAGALNFSGLGPSAADFVVARYLGDAGPRISTPFSGKPVSVPAEIIEAENFDNGGEGVAYHDTTQQNLGGAYRNSFVDLKALAGASNGYAVGYTDAGEWLKYTISVTAGGTYTLQSRVASYLPGGAFHVELDGNNVTGTINVPDTGGWSNWQTLTSRPFTLSSGNHVMRLVEDRIGTLGAVANFDTFRFAVTEFAGRVGVWDPGTKSFYLDTNNNGVFDKVGDTTVAWKNATSSMIPVTGDWSGAGHGKYTGLFDCSTASWQLDMNENNVASDSGDVIYSRFGNTGDLPVVGDWTGNGKTRIGVWRPSQNSFTLDINGDGIWESGTDRWFQITLPFNSSDTYTPVAGDWNGDGKTQIGFFDSTTHTWYLDQHEVADSTHVFSKLAFGNSWDQPLVGRWNPAYGFSQVGTWRPGDSTIRLDFNGDGILDTGDRSYAGWGLAKNDVPVGI